MKKCLLPQLGLLTVIVALTACGSDSKLSRLTDFDLAERHGYCLDKTPTAPGQVQACTNIQRECEARKAELGSYICRHH